MTPPTPYTITKTLSHGGRAVVYRAIRNADGCPVVLKVLDPRRRRPRDLEQLKLEYEIGTRLTSRAVVRPLALETYQGMPALVLEDFGGESLDSSLGGPMAVEGFLSLAIGITGAVADVHRQGLVHRDIKPANILVNPATGEVKLATPPPAPSRAPESV